MNKSNFWYVKCTHSPVQYNDTYEYTLFNGCGDKIAFDYDRKVLDTVCLKHNECFLNDEMVGDDNEL